MKDYGHTNHSTASSSPLTQLPTRDQYQTLYKEQPQLLHCIHFVLLMVYFAMQKLFIFMRSLLLIVDLGTSTIGIQEVVSCLFLDFFHHVRSLVEWGASKTLRVCEKENMESSASLLTF